MGVAGCFPRALQAVDRRGRGYQTGLEVAIVAHDWEDTLNSWAQPPSNTEEQRSDNAIRGIRNAVNGSSKLNQRRIKVFTQGSYRNRFGWHPTSQDTSLKRIGATDPLAGREFR